MFLLPIIVAYLLGSIPFGLVVSKLVGIRELRTLGSGNIGATNVWRVAGFKVAIWVFIGDIAKGIAAVLLAGLFIKQFPISIINTDMLLILCALAAVLGHVFPIYIGFRGGKGVNTALGVMIALLPVEALISFGVFLIVVVVTKYVSLGSIIGAVTFFVIVIIEKYVLSKEIADIYVIVVGLIALLILVTHRKNIARLLSGTENKLTRGMRSGKAGSNA
jgi:glycerol-3-phosphate acyltransferase PlsY